MVLPHPQPLTLVLELQISVELEKPLKGFCVNPCVYTCILGLNKWQLGSRRCILGGLIHGYSALEFSP